MRHLTLAVLLAAGCMFVGCDNKPDSSSGTKPDPKAEPAKGDAAKATEPAKSEPAKAAVAKHPWGSFGKGSMAKLKSVTEAAGTKSESTMTYTLTDLTADEAVVEMEMAMTGFTNKTPMKFPLKAPAGDGKAVEGPKPKTGTEELELAGKKLKCTWTEMDTDANGMKTNSKTWMCDEVPGNMVKMVSKSTGAATSTTTMELVEFIKK